MFKNERGYTLFLVVFIVIMFGVLSTALLALTTSGAQRNVVREDVTKATELSEKGTNHIVQKIQKELVDSIGPAGVTKDVYQANIATILQKYLCEGGSETIDAIQTEDGDYVTCVESYQDGQGNNGDLKKLVTLKSTGTVDNQEKEIKTTIELGVSSVPDVLNYAVGTNITSNNPRNGEGNLLLHGGVEITGDLKVDGHLITHDKGTGAYNWLHSIRPRVKSLQVDTEPRLVLGENMYTLRRDPTTGNEWNHESYLQQDPLRSNNHTQQQNPEALFDQGYAPKLVERETKETDIDITGNREAYYYDERSGGVSLKETNGTIRNQKYPLEKIYPYTKTCFFRCTSNYNSRITLSGQTEFKQFANKGRLIMRSGHHKFKEGLYAGNGITIGNNGQSPSENISIEGTMYVDGNVDIQGTNLKANAMLFVDGDVEIRFSTIEGLQTENGTGTLIIFATGDIFIANISERQDAPSDINGYFYSEEFLELYGVGSNVRIKGGIAAKRVVLNAIRGIVRPGNISGRNYYVNQIGYYQSPTAQRNERSRLQVIYDPELIENYLQLNPPEELIKEIELPKYIDRED